VATTHHPSAGRSHPRHRRTRLLRRAGTAAATLGVMAVLVSPGASASPKPDIKTIKAKLAALTTQVDGLIQQYDQTVEDLSKARRQLGISTAQINQEQATYNQLHTAVARMAAGAYERSGGTGNGPLTSVLAARDPQTVLDQVSVFAAISKDRGSVLAQFLSSAALLTRARAAQQATITTITAKQTSLGQQTTALKKQIAEQQRLLGEAGGPTPGQGTCDVQAGGKALIAIQFACGKLGTPYLWGGTGPRYDCSGLTQAAWAAAGISLPRTTYEQWDVGTHVGFGQLQPGDLVFFEASLGHMGMYLGGGKMIHAPHTGDVVKISDISSGYYRQEFQGGVRVTS
jgi:cell wall-associated NlpC family hydrolase